MIIDTHCHFDMMDSPEEYIEKVEKSGNIVIGMTNLPNHFAMGYKHVCKYKKVRLALGYHPQLAKKDNEELMEFQQLVSTTSYIGEIGLDFSKEYVCNKETQIRNFDFICQCISNANKIVSVHSRRAEKEVLAILKKYSIKNVIFHWYSGPLGLIDEIVNEGYYFSINEAMTRSVSGKKIISRIPECRILTETDAPYNRYISIHNVLHFLNLEEDLIKDNFFNLLGTLTIKQKDKNKLINRY